MHSNGSPLRNQILLAISSVFSNEKRPSYFYLKMAFVTNSKTFHSNRSEATCGYFSSCSLEGEGLSKRRERERERERERVIEITTNSKVH